MNRMAPADSVSPNQKKKELLQSQCTKSRTMIVGITWKFNRIYQEGCRKQKHLWSQQYRHQNPHKHHSWVSVSVECWVFLFIVLPMFSQNWYHSYHHYLYHHRHNLQKSPQVLPSEKLILRLGPLLFVAAATCATGLITTGTCAQDPGDLRCPLWLRSRRTCLGLA